jgi:hypothetical protein
MPFYCKLLYYRNKWRLFIRLITVLGCLALPCKTSQAEKLPSSDIHIPDSLHIQIITLDDGSEVVGRISEVDDNQIVFKSSLGESRIGTDKIHEIREIPVSSLRNGKYWFPNPNQTRLYFSPTDRKSVV